MTAKKALLAQSYNAQEIRPRSEPLPERARRAAFSDPPWLAEHRDAMMPVNTRERAALHPVHTSGDAAPRRKERWPSTARKPPKRLNARCTSVNGERSRADARGKR